MVEFCLADLLHRGAANSPDAPCLTFEGATLFQDLETGEELEIDPAAVRKNYVERMQSLAAFYRKGLTEIGADYHLIDTAQPYEQALSAYLSRRTKIRK